MPKCSVEMRGPLAHLVLDDADAKLNTLGRTLLAELKPRLATLKLDPAVRAVVLRSAKPAGFLAGADLRELQELAASPRPAEAGREAARAGQELMDLVEDLGKPVVAALHGAALGGGCELALACSARVAAAEGLKLGLPEVQLGILPGFGGSWRLPRLIGYAAALPAILQGTAFDGRRALQAGLVDELAPLESLPERAEALALALLEPEGRRRLAKARRSRAGGLRRLLDLRPLRGLLLARARRQVLAKSGRSYPAPLKVLELLAGHGRERSAGLAREAQALGELLATPVCRNLLRLFFLGQEAKKQAAGAAPARLERAAVVGAGFMGSGIAIPLVGRAKLPTILKEGNLEVLGRALKKVRAHLDKQVSRRRLSPLQAQQAFQLLAPGAEAQDLRRADFVIEAVPEQLELKRKVFAELEALVGPEAVLASNTSTLPIAEIAQGAVRPARFVGMHFFSPAELMPLVEIIPGPATAPSAVAAAVELSLKMGKTPVVVKDSPGFLVNRILMPYILEAAQLVQEGTPVSAVERAALDFGMPVGPLKLMGEVGIPVIQHVFAILRRHYADHLPEPAWVLRPDLAEAFPRGSDGKLKLNAARIQALAAGGRPAAGASEAEAAERLFLAMLNEAARALAEGVVSEPGLLDLSLVYGAGFPAWRGGLLREAEARGLGACLLRCQQLSRQAPWLAPSEALRAAASRGGFGPRA